MGWATPYILQLQQGKTVQFRPRGDSMSPRIRSGQLCVVEPVNSDDIQVGDVVLCRVRGHEYLHFVKAIRGPQFQIGNNRGLINGWVTSKNIFGRCVRVED